MQASCEGLGRVAIWGQDVAWVGGGVLNGHHAVLPSRAGVCCRALSGCLNVGQPCSKPGWLGGVGP
jgi:hypothetical protein